MLVVVIMMTMMVALVVVGTYRGKVPLLPLPAPRRGEEKGVHCTPAKTAAGSRLALGRDYIPRVGKQRGDAPTWLTEAAMGLTQGGNQDTTPRVAHLEPSK